VGSEPFAWIADQDARLGPMLEAIVNGRYYWLPFQRLKEIRVEKPSDLRDFVWTPAYLTLANGGETVALIPTRYPGSEASPDGAIRMSRKTTWEEVDGDTALGLGQRILITDQGELPIMDVRSISLDGVAEAEPEAPAPADG
jgi:type VI secretion system protein ImpE